MNELSILFGIILLLVITIGLLIAYGDEGFIKKRYRKFNIKIQKNEQDDYGMMREVLNRRFKRAIQEKDNYLTFPDLILIDGGKGQVGAAMTALKQLNLQIPLIGLAKQEEEIVLPNEEETLKFKKTSSMMLLLRKIRDETHNFVINYNRKKRQMKMRKETLELAKESKKRNEAKKSSAN